MRKLGFPETSIPTANLGRVTSKKSEGLNYAAAESRGLELTSPSNRLYWDVLCAI